MNRWDLTPLVGLDETLDGLVKQAESDSVLFAEKYQGRVVALSPAELHLAIEAFEAISLRVGRIMSYASLRFAEDTAQGGLYAQYELATNGILSNLLFFEIELAEMGEDFLQKMREEAPWYAYYLQKILEAKRHTLTLPEERVALKLAPVGADAFARLFDEHFSRLLFKCGGRNLSEEETLALLHHPERAMRKKGATALTKVLKAHQNLLAYVLNMVRKEHAIVDKMRSYSSPEESRHLSNQITQKSVDSMVDAANLHMDVVHEFYKIKRELLGLKRLYDYDRYAPLSQSEEKIEYSQAQRMVCDVMEAFSPLFGEITRRAFTEGWIDSHPRLGKRGGAFSHGTVPTAHPYVLLNYTDGRRDVFTMAHEMGHAIHQELSKGVGYLYADTPLTTAETASVFAEMLLFDAMQQNLPPKERIALYAGKLEDIFATLFRQVVFTNFERRIHQVTDELTPEVFNQIWLEENQKMFGESVELTEGYALWWSYIPHFVHTPFYCYAYSYGQLLVLALFGIYKRGFPDFKEKYVKFLSLGGSQSPSALVALFGFDIEKSDFWEIGLQEVRNLTEEFRRMVAHDL